MGKRQVDNKSKHRYDQDLINKDILHLFVKEN